jgi:hypothetical protein
MSVSKRADQVIARVTVVNGNHESIPGVEVKGTWSGVITGGDTSRITDQAGVATFYSARSRTAGGVTFCVAGMTISGMTYDAGANLETCDTVSK